jgi:hypothetical protein
MSSRTLLPTLTAAAALLAGCGSSNPSSTTAAAASGAASDIAFSNCMRGHGVPNFPDLSQGSAGGLQIQASDHSGSGPSTKVNGVPVNGPAFQAAMSKCRSLLPHNGHPPPGGAAAVRKHALKFAECMRSHGVSNFPDPQVTSLPGGGVGVRMGGPGSGIDPSSPAFQAAQKACSSGKNGLLAIAKAP